MANQTFKLKSGLTLTPVDLTTLTNPQAGDLACDINDNNKIKRYDADLTVWLEVGSAAAGDVDTLLVQDFDTASLSTFTQTGLTLITTNPLDGRQSARLIHDVPVTGVVRSFKQTIAVPPKFRGVNMTASLTLRSTASQGNVTIQFRDETNSIDYPSQQLQTNSQSIASLVTNSTTLVSGFSNSVINSLKVGMSVTGSGIPTGTTIASINSTALTITLSQAATASATVSLRFSDLPRTIQLGFNIPANCSSYSYIISALQEAGLPETYVDDIVLKNYWLGMSNQGQSTVSLQTANVTAWQQYTPTFQGFGTAPSGPTNIEFEWRQVGENVEIRGKFTAGTTTAVEARIGLPAGLTSAGTSLIPSLQQIGFGARNTAGTGDYKILIEPSVTYLTFSRAETGLIGLFKETGNNILSSGQALSFFASVPCAGLTATSTQSFITTDLVPAKAVFGNTSLEIPSITSWQGYTPTFQGFGSPTNIEFEWRQVGENVEIRGKFTSGTVTAVEARVGLPAGLTSASSGILPSIQIAGTYHSRLIDSGNVPNIENVYIETSVSYVTFQRQGVSTITKALGTQMATSSADYLLMASVPCAGLSATSTKTIPLTQSGLVQNADSYIRVNSSLGNGSTNTFVRRFSNVLENIGNAFTYTPSATLGDTLTVNYSGNYTITYVDGTGTLGTGMGVSKNFSTNTSPLLIPAANRLQFQYTEASANWLDEMSWSGYLAAGDVLRFHNSVSTVTTSNPDAIQFTASYQGSLKQVSVSSDQKITIPTSELRMEGASTRGSTATAIVRFDTTAKLRGDAFTVESDSVLGTRITMKKAGKLDVNTTIFRSGSTNNIYISKNQLILTGLPSQSETMSGTFHSGTNDQECVSWSGFVSINDVIRISTSQTPTADIRNNLNLAFQEQDISVSVTNTLPQFSESDSSVRVNTATGYGSTSGNKIRRFSNLADNIGTDIEYVDSPTNGATFTIKSSGIYSVSYSDNFSAASRFGISKNASSLTSSLELLTSSEILGVEISASGGQDASISWTGYLVAGDIIRPHTDGGGNSQVIRSSFTISKVGKPNVTGVNVTPFVNVPQPDLSEIRFEGASTRGSTATAIVRFDINAKLKGSGLAVTSDATNGTVITVLKAGRLTLNATLVLTNGRFSITRNQATLTALTAIASEILSSAEAAGTVPITASAVTDVVVGDVIRISSNVTPSSNAVNNFTVTLSALSDQILTAPETFSTDTASLRYANASEYTLSTLANAPVGTYITFTYAANTNTRTQTTLTNRPTQTDADMNVNGIRLFSRSGGFGTLTSASNPSSIAIQIGKGLKGKSIDAYFNSGKQLPFAIDKITTGSGEYGTYVFYDEKTGILQLDAALFVSGPSTAISGVGTDFANNATRSDGYFVINASKSPALTGLNFNQIGGRFTSNSGQSVGDNAVILFNTVEFDSNGAYSTGTGVYTIPVSGFYQINASILLTSTTAFRQLSIAVNGTIRTTNYIDTVSVNETGSIRINELLRLNRGDQVTIVNGGAGSGATGNLNTDPKYNSFSIARIGV